MKTFEVEAAALGGGGSEWAPSTRELLRLVREIDSETLKELETNIAHLRKGELTAAKQRLTDFMGKSPEAWHGKFLLALVERRLEERTAAIEHLAELTKVAPELEPVWLHLSAALRENGELDAATEVLFGAARAHPHWIRTARALAAAGPTPTLDPEAVIRVVAISARRTNDPDLIMDLAQLWLARGDHAAATAVLEVLDTLGGDSARRHLIRGQLAAATGLRERATAEFCRALERDPDLEAAQTGLAELLRHAG